MNNLADITQKLESSQRLDRSDGLALWQCPDILSLGRLALLEKKKRSGGQVYFNVNRHLNLTNVCVARCHFCAFSCDRGDPGAYLMTAEDAAARVRAALPAGITEVHMVSGLHPEQPFSYYVDMVRKIRSEFPALHLKAFTPVEIQYFSEIAGLGVEAVLCELKEAGLGSLPGGGAEVLSRRVREQLCPEKASAAQWLDIMRTAHHLGLRTNATLLFGHVETPEEVIEHLLQLRDLQDETGGFQTFVPLPFHPGRTQLEGCVKPSACEILKIFCVARLMLDNFDHIKAYWIMTGLKTAQLSLYFGADDIDGTVMEEKITHAAGAETSEGLSTRALIRMVREAGFAPVQRDTLYNVVETY